MGKGGKMELDEVKFKIEGRKVRAKGNRKRKSAGGETEVVTTADLEHILVVFVDSILLWSLLVLVLGSGLKQ